MNIEELDYESCKGKRYRAEIRSTRYLSIEPEIDGRGNQADSFIMEWKECDIPLCKTLEDDMLSDWLENPTAFGAYEDGNLIGFTEGFLEQWNNRYRITNICVFDAGKRHCGAGSQLLQKIESVAAASGARIIVLETQSFNAPAISFYKKNGYQIIGFDRFSYSNTGPEDHTMRIEMGKILPVLQKL